MRLLVKVMCGQVWCLPKVVGSEQKRALFVHSFPAATETRTCDLWVTSQALKNSVIALVVMMF